MGQGAVAVGGGTLGVEQAREGVIVVGQRQGQKSIELLGPFRDLAFQPHDVLLEAVFDLCRGGGGLDANRRFAVRQRHAQRLGEAGFVVPRQQRDHRAFLLERAERKNVRERRDRGRCRRGVAAGDDGVVKLACRAEFLFGKERGVPLLEGAGGTPEPGVQCQGEQRPADTEGSQCQRRQGQQGGEARVLARGLPPGGMRPQDQAQPDMGQRHRRQRRRVAHQCHHHHAFGDGGSATQHRQLGPAQPAGAGQSPARCRLAQPVAGGDDRGVKPAHRA